VVPTQLFGPVTNRNDADTMHSMITYLVRVDGGFSDMVCWPCIENRTRGDTVRGPFLQ